MKNITIPVSPKAEQTEIRQKIIEYFSQMNQYKYLLEYTKRAVEMEI